jgi:hypothetical protein
VDAQLQTEERLLASRERTDRQLEELGKAMAALPAPSARHCRLTLAGQV